MADYGVPPNPPYTTHATHATHTININIAPPRAALPRNNIQHRRPK